MSLAYWSDKKKGTSLKIKNRCKIYRQNPLWALCLLSSPSNVLAFVYLRSFIHSFSHLNIYKDFLCLLSQGMTPKFTKLPDHPWFLSLSRIYLFLPESLSSLSQNLINGHVLLLLLLNFLFNTYGHSSSSSHHHLQVYSNSLQPVTLAPAFKPPTCSSHPAARGIFHKLPSEERILFACLKPLMAFHCLQEKAQTPEQS